MKLFLSFSVDLISYLTKFEWDMAKYPIKQPLKNVSEALAKVMFLPEKQSHENSPQDSCAFIPRLEAVRVLWVTLAETNLSILCVLLRGFVSW